MSVAGVARDLAARLGCPSPARAAGPSRRRAGAGVGSRVEILDPDLCGRFTARVLAAWPSGRRRVDGQPAHALGMRPINNVVDVSNYVMLELGQPNHPYDLATGSPVAGFRVRGPARARPDRHPRRRRATSPPATTCSSATATTRPIGIAGVMGGASTEISEPPPRCCSRWPGSSPMAIAAPPPARPAQRGVGPLRAGLSTPRASSGPARFASCCGLTDGGPPSPPARSRTAGPCRTAPVRPVRRPGSTRCSAPTSPPTRSGGPARADRLRHRARRRTTSTWRCRRGGRTASRDRRRRGGRPPHGYAAIGKPGADARPPGRSPPPARSAAGAPGARRAGLLRGHAPAVPRPGRPGARRPPPDGITCQPAGGRGVVLRTSLLPGPA
jgi:hypothetical protein